MPDHDRGTMLLEQARRQCERAIAEAAVLRRLVPRTIALGETMHALLVQIRRLRANPCPTMKFGLDPLHLRMAIRAELTEVAREVQGSPRAQAEAMDIVAAAFHHAIAQGVDILVGLDAVTTKLEGRLDAMARGLTWEQAKAEEQDL